MPRPWQRLSEIQLLRGKLRPSESPRRDFKEQLVWLYPDEQPAQLFWCNENDEWFELSFTPVQKP